jgi:hypothetical protein
MKAMKRLGLVAGVVAMCALFGLVGSVASHWDAPPNPNQETAATQDGQPSPSIYLTMAVATAQEATSLTQ